MNDNLGQNLDSNPNINSNSNQASQVSLEAEFNNKASNSMATEGRCHIRNITDKVEDARDNEFHLSSPNIKKIHIDDPYINKKNYKTNLFSNKISYNLSEPTHHPDIIYNNSLITDEHKVDKTNEENKANEENLPQEIENSNSKNEDIKPKKSFKQQNKDFTIKDYENLDLLKRLVYDKRTYFDYLWDSIRDDHMLFSIFFKNSLFIPSYIRIMKAVSMVSCIFGMNAILYTDDSIEEKYRLDHIPNSNQILYSIPKSFYAFLITLVVNFLICLIIYIPDRVEEKLMKAIRTKNKLIIPYMQ